MILNSPGTQILANVSSEKFAQIVKVLEAAILSTDLALYFRRRDSFFAIVQHVKECAMVPHSEAWRLAPWGDDDDRELLRAMLMTICDLSAITKPWPIEKRVADLVSSEFFEQGDVERQEFNITPIVMLLLSN